MMRVALIAGSLGIGGTEKQLVYIAKALHASHVDVHVFYSSAPDPLSIEQLQTAGIPTLSYGGPKQRWKRVWVLYRQLAAFKPHIVQSIRLYTNYYLALKPLLHTTTIGGSGTSLDHEIALMPIPFKRQAVNLALRLPDRLMVHSEVTRREICEAHIRPENHVYILPTVTDVQKFGATAQETTPKVPPIPGIQRDRVIVFVGRLSHVKRVDRALRAFAIAVQQIPDLQFILAGDGPEKDKLELLAHELNIHEQVHFLGYYSDIPALLQSSAILVLCSDQEGLPNVIMEAMAAQLPVVTTPAGSVSQVVTDGETGYIVDFDNHEQMAAAFVRLIQQPELRATFGKRARERIEKSHSSQALGEMLLETYRHFITNPQLIDGAEKA